MNTVHVTDVCRALWHLREAGNSGDVYNLADKGRTSVWRIILCINITLVYHPHPPTAFIQLFATSILLSPGHDSRDGVTAV